MKQKREKNLHERLFSFFFFIERNRFASDADFLMSSMTKMKICSDEANRQKGKISEGTRELNGKTEIEQTRQRTRLCIGIKETGQTRQRGKGHKRTRLFKGIKETNRADNTKGQRTQTNKAFQLNKGDRQGRQDREAKDTNKQTGQTMCRLQWPEPELMSRVKHNS